MWTPFLFFAKGTLSLVEVRWGRASIPKLCFLFNVAGGRIRLCGLLSRCWMVDSDFFFFLFCPSSESGWDGRVCGVVVRKVCLPDCGWDGHVLVFLPGSGESRSEW